jgi:hypothetical protein
MQFYTLLSISRLSLLHYYLDWLGHLRCVMIVPMHNVKFCEGEGVALPPCFLSRQQKGNRQLYVPVTSFWRKDAVLPIEHKVG